jgi:hypothetical protein
MIINNFEKNISSMKRIFTLLIFLSGLSLLLKAENDTVRSPKIYIAFLWHMHQPIYYPYQNIVQTEQSGVFSFSLFNVHLSRTGPYTDWPRNAVQKGINANMPHFGAQVSFSGSLIENLNNLQQAGVGFSNWKSHWNYIKNQQTSLGNPRMDMVGFGYHHPLMGLIDYADIRRQIQEHKTIFAQHFTGSYSKGIFPPETAFSPRVIPALVDEGFEWVIIDNLHFDRTAQNAPVSDGSGVLRPNKADVRNPDPQDWKQLNGLWAPTPVSIRWGHQPRYVSYTDPASGTTKRIIGIPASRYLGEEDGRGGFGALNYEHVMSQFEQYNTDPSRPILIVLHHDGDNYGGGSESYYNSNFQNFINWLQGQTNRFECTTIQDYLERFPVPENDVIHVQDGSWLGAAGGDPQFRKWNGEPGNYPGASGPYSPDRNSWGIMTAAKNIVETAQQVNPNAGGTQQGWKFYLNGQASDYWYWDGTEIWDSNPVRAANQAVNNALPVAQGGTDLTAPSIYLPQRYPYNPGAIEWDGAGVMPSDFTVWTYAFDLNGLANVTLKYRISNTETVQYDNMIYAGGAGTGPWQSLPMTGISITSVTDPMPLHKAKEYSAQINGYQNKLIDYYVEAVDTKGNLARSPIQHVWVGDGSGGSSGNVSWSPQQPNLNEIITITAKHATSQTLLHWGVNNWDRPIAAYRPAGTTEHEGSNAVQTPPTGQNNEGHYFWNLGPFNNIQQQVNQVAFVLKINDSQWDNNNGNDWFISIDNDPNPNPVGANGSVSMLMGNPYSFSTNDFYYQSPIGSGFAGIRAESLPDKGSLTYNGTAVTIGQVCPNPSLLMFTPVAGQQGDPYTSFTFKVKDQQQQYSTQTYTMLLRVLSGNPVGQNSTVSMLVNETFQFAASHFAFSSPAGNTFGGIRIEALPAKGQLLKNGTAVLTGELVNNPGQMTFVPAAGETGNPYTSFSYRLVDSQGLESNSTYQLSIVVAGNFPPGISWYPQTPSTQDVITVVVSGDANMQAASRLHWGVNQWTKPNEVYWPAGSQLWSDGVAVQSPFAQHNNAWTIQLGPFNNSLQAVNKLDFVIHYGGENWNNNGGQDWHIDVVDYSAVPEHFNEQEITVIPNPVQTHARILVRGNTEEKFFVTLSDIQGRVRARTVVIAGEEMILQRNGLAPGLYILEAGNEGKRLISRIVLN